MRIKITLFLSLVTSFTLFGQTSVSERTRNWITGSSWVGGTMPGSLSSGTVTANTSAITINGTTATATNVNLIISSLTINAGDTLVVMGNMGLYAASSLTNNGVLVVMGNFVNSASGNSITSTGKMVVTGNYVNTVGLVNNFTGPSYVFGSTSGFLFAPSVSNEAGLISTDPSLHNYVGSMFSSLPVELLFFKAQIEGNETLVSWKTATEKNNDHFAIERSGDGKKFELIERVSGAGNSKQPRLYQISDSDAPIGYTYYRLSQFDYDGKVTVFNVVCVNRESSKIALYPNPVVTELYLNVVDTQYIVSVSDVNGMQRIRPGKVFQFASGNFGVDVSVLESGFYSLHVTSLTDNKTQSYSFVKN